MAARPQLAQRARHRPRRGDLAVHGPRRGPDQVVHRAHHLWLAGPVLAAEAGLQLAAVQRPGDHQQPPRGGHLAGVRALQPGAADGLPGDPERRRAAVDPYASVVDGEVGAVPAGQPAGGEPFEPLAGVGRPQVGAAQRRGEHRARLLRRGEQLRQALLLLGGAAPPGLAQPADHRDQQQHDAEDQQHAQADQAGPRASGHDVAGDRAHTIFPSSTVGRPARKVACTCPGIVIPR